MGETVGSKEKLKPQARKACRMVQKHAYADVEYLANGLKERNMLSLPTCTDPLFIDLYFQSYAVATDVYQRQFYDATVDVYRWSPFRYSGARHTLADHRYQGPIWANFWPKCSSDRLQRCSFRSGTCPAPQLDPPCLSTKGSGCGVGAGLQMKMTKRGEN